VPYLTLQSAGDREFIDVPMRLATLQTNALPCYSNPTSLQLSLANQHHVLNLLEEIMTDEADSSYAHWCAQNVKNAVEVLGT
jgi:hypothetical protein